MNGNHSNDNDKEGANGGGDVWVYHEKQEALLCGQHALNNLVQECVFSAESLAEMAHQLDEMELTYMAQNNEGGVKSKEYLQRLAEGSGNVDPHGNFSIQVLRSALQNKFDLELPNIRQEGISKQEPTSMDGFICNKQQHWFAIRKINGRYWNLNSTADRPASISHFNVAAELKKLIADGYSVFCVAVDDTKTIPPACLSVQEMERRNDRQHGGVKGNWWRESDLLLGRTSGKNGSVGGDPWKNVGSGMRLDGKSTAAAAAPAGAGTAQDWTQALTEEEQLQMAVAFSLEGPPAAQTTSPAATAAIPKVPVPPEPAVGTPGAVRIQFRLPSQPRVVRRFLESDSVAVIMSFCSEQEGGKNMDLRYGFPPKDLKPLASQTIGQAKLAGESIQGRCI